MLDDFSYIESIASRKGPTGRIWDRSPTDVSRPLWTESKEEAS